MHVATNRKDKKKEISRMKKILLSMMLLVSLTISAQTAPLHSLADDDAETASMTFSYNAENLTLTTTPYDDNVAYTLFILITHEMEGTEIDTYTADMVANYPSMEELAENDWLLYGTLEQDLSDYLYIYGYRTWTAFGNYIYDDLSISAPFVYTFHVVDPETAGITDVETAQKARKCLKDGKIVISKNGKEYNALGEAL